MLRHTSRHELTLWCVLTEEPAFRVILDGVPLPQDAQVQHVFRVGERAWIAITKVALPHEVLSLNTLFYDLIFESNDNQSRWLDERKRILYGDDRLFSFRIPSELRTIAHGSCRKPHFAGSDALTRIDEAINAELQGGAPRPDILIMTGDQIYCDDVAGPMLVAIHQVIDMLGLYHEDFNEACVANSQALWSHPHNFYCRERLLPQGEANEALHNTFFGGKKKPIFTSANARNHLVAFSEMIAMYLLVWSPSLWTQISLNMPKEVPEAYHPLYEKERALIMAFIATLPQVRRALAQIPVYMIFDDHDVTDDWNLNRAWEAQAYQHPFSKRIVGNALFAYFLCQGVANQPDNFTTLITCAQDTLSANGITEHDKMIDVLLSHAHWHYHLPTTPMVYVMDTRTQRWRSESDAQKPSGLLDWEALCDFQQQIIGQRQVVVVSAAPIFGVKIIEVIQKIFTWMGKALMVDAENWMAHRGTAKVLLNILCHSRTADTFVILSGDVHYSFVYDISMRFRRHGPDILQFTASGIKNAFPDKLLQPLARLNYWLYGPNSWLNIFTRRRRLKIISRRPNVDSAHDLLNRPAIGLLRLSATTHEMTCKALCADGETVEFTPSSHLTTLEAPHHVRH